MTPSWMTNVAPAIVTALVVAGCASTNRDTPSFDDDKVYVTGSRIPVRDRSTVLTTSDRNAIDDMMRHRTIVVPAKGGGN
jgi:hypothetical protein